MICQLTAGAVPAERTERGLDEVYRPRGWLCVHGALLVLLGLEVFICLCALHNMLPLDGLLPGFEITVTGVSTNEPTISWPSTTRLCALRLGVLWNGGGFRLMAACFSKVDGGLYEWKREYGLRGGGPVAINRKKAWCSKQHFQRWRQAPFDGVSKPCVLSSEFFSLTLSMKYLPWKLIQLVSRIVKTRKKCEENKINIRQYCSVLLSVSLFHYKIISSQIYLSTKKKERDKRIDRRTTGLAS